MKITTIVEAKPLCIEDVCTNETATGCLKLAAEIIEYAIKALPGAPNIKITASNIPDRDKNPDVNRVTFTVTHEASA